MNTTPLGYAWAAALGFVQGATEFLPVSSSGHLALAGHLGMGGPSAPVFDALLHVATLFAVVVYFRSAVAWYARNDPRVLVHVVTASIPTGLTGLLGKSYLEALRLSPTMICVGLLVTAAALSLAELKSRADCRLGDLGWFGAFAVGLCQALAIAPGVSRSGATIAGAVLCGVDKEEAFRFSFILSIPAVLGAALLQVHAAAGDGGSAAFFASQPAGPLAVGFAVAAVVGYAALAALRRLVAGGRLVWFAGYCFAAAAAGLVYFDIFA